MEAAIQIEALREKQFRAACTAKITDLGVIHSELVVEGANEFRNDDVEIGVALAVPVPRLIDRHTVDERAEIGAVVEVEATYEVLVGLTLPRMLRDDQIGRREPYRQSVYDSSRDRRHRRATVRV